MIPILQLDHALLDGIPSIRSVNGTTWLDVICKLAGGIFSLFLYVIIELLNCTVPNMDIWGTSLVTDVNKGTEPITMTLWGTNSIQPTCPCIKSSLQSREDGVWPCQRPYIHPDRWRPQPFLHPLTSSFHPNHLNTLKALLITRNLSYSSLPPWQTSNGH